MEASGSPYRIQDQAVIRLENVANVPGIVNCEPHAQLVEAHAGPGASPKNDRTFLRVPLRSKRRVIRPLLATLDSVRTCLRRARETPSIPSADLRRGACRAQVQGYAGPALIYPRQHLKALKVWCPSRPRLPLPSGSRVYCCRTTSLAYRQHAAKRPCSFSCPSVSARVRSVPRSP